MENELPTKYWICCHPFSHLKTWLECFTIGSPYAGSYKSFRKQHVYLSGIVVYLQSEQENWELSENWVVCLDTWHTQRLLFHFFNKVARMVLFQFKICPRPNFFTVMSAHFVTWLFISSSALTCVNPPPHMLSSKCTQLFPFPRRGQVLCPLDHHIWVCLQLFSFLGLLKLDPIHLQLTVKFNTVQSSVYPIPMGGHPLTCFQGSSSCHHRALRTLKSNALFPSPCSLSDCKCLEGRDHV